MRHETSASRAVGSRRQEANLYEDIRICRVEPARQFPLLFLHKGPPSRREKAMPTILILDDNRYLRILYGLELRAEGYIVVLASDGDDALKKIEAVHPDLVIMDVNRHQADGPDVIAKILDKTNGIPVILNTAFDTPESVFMSWAADACLTKSSDLSELKDTIKDLLDRSAQYQGDGVPAR
jgi:DNA-binding response OmpR family regulator